MTHARPMKNNEHHHLIITTWQLSLPREHEEEDRVSLLASKMLTQAHLVKHRSDLYLDRHQALLTREDTLMLII